MEKNQVEKACQWQMGLTPPKVIFYNFLKRSYYTYGFVSASYKKICAELGISYIGLHGLRHTHATM